MHTQTHTKQVNVTELLRSSNLCSCDWLRRRETSDRLQIISFRKKWICESFCAHSIIETHLISYICWKKKKETESCSFSSNCPNYKRLYACWWLAETPNKQTVEIHTWLWGHVVCSVPVSAMPMLRMVALCFCGKSSGAALKLKVPSSFFIILKIRMVSPFANQVINALRWKGERWWRRRWDYHVPVKWYHRCVLH